MAYHVTSPVLGMQPIDETSTTQKHPLGTIVTAVDPTFGVGEFIYLLGVASTAVGSLVAYNTVGFATVLAPVGNNRSRPIAVAMSANVASQYGWYQIGGVAVMKKTCSISLAASAPVGVLTIGLVAGTGSGKEIQGAYVAAVASATAGRTSVRVMIQRPSMQGRIT